MSDNLQETAQDKPTPFKGASWSAKEVVSAPCESEDLHESDRDRSKGMLNPQGSRKFVPKTNLAPETNEFKLEFVLNSDITLSLKVTQDSNPFKLSEYILGQMEFANQDYFTAESLERVGVQSKYHTK